MRGLIQSNLAAARELDGGPDSPALFGNLGAFYFFGFQRLDGSLQIAAHQVEAGLKRFVLACVSVGGMDGDFRGRQREDEPSTAGIHGTKLQDILKERAIRVRIFTVEQDMGAVNHACDHIICLGK